MVWDWNNSSYPKPKTHPLYLFWCNDYNNRSMPKRRTTGCAQQHYGKNCPDCTRIRVRRYRARKRRNAERTHAAHRRTASSQRRGELRARVSAPRSDRAARRLRALRTHNATFARASASQALPLAPPIHASILVAWLCGDCRRIVRSTREPLTLTWTWPGLRSGLGPSPLVFSFSTRPTLNCERTVIGSVRTTKELCEGSASGNTSASSRGRLHEGVIM